MRVRARRRLGWGEHLQKARVVLMPNRSRLSKHLLTRVLRPHVVSVDELEVGLCHPPGRGARSNESAVKKP